MDSTTVQLIDHCRQGKRSAQLTFYRKYAKMLYGVCLRITGDVSEAEEAMQDAFLRIFSRMALYDTGQCLEAWIKHIAVNTAIDYLRKRKPAWEELPADYPEPEDAGPDENDAQYSVEKIREAVQKLPSGYRVVVSLFLFEGYDMEEISAILHIQSASVRSQYLRAKRKLLELINN